MNAPAPILAALAVVLVGVACRPRPPGRQVAAARARRGVRTPSVGRLLRATRSLRRRRRADPSDLARWCDDVARALRSGRSLRAALEQVDAADPALARAVADIRSRSARGAAVPEALRTSSPGSTDDAIGHVFVVLATAAEVGGDVARPVERAAVALRARAADELERASQSAQARLSGRVLTALPVCMLLVLCVADPDVRRAVASTAGAVAVSAGLGLNAVGWVWMRAIVSGVRR